jgi:5'-nucleotidase
MDPKFHLTGDDAADYRAARFHAQQFARSLLASPLAPDVQALSINVPASATPFTPWRLTRASRHRGYTPMAPDRANGHGRPRYREIDGGEYTEADSDIWAVKVDRIVSVTPLSLNLTSRVSFRSTTQILANGMAERAALADVAKTRPQSTPPTPSVGDSDGHDSWGWSELPDLQASLQIRRRS